MHNFYHRPIYFSYYIHKIYTTQLYFVVPGYLGLAVFCGSSMLDFSPIPPPIVARVFVCSNWLQVVSFCTTCLAQNSEISQNCGHTTIAFSLAMTHFRWFGVPWGNPILGKPIFCLQPRSLPDVVSQLFGSMAASISIV